MHEEIFRALQEGATVLTAGRRLARVLARDFHSMQVERGNTLWNRPDVLPLDAFLDRTWSEWLGRYGDESAPVLLDQAQEQMLWERIIRESPAGATLLQIPETARKAMDTWRLMMEYRLPLDGSFEATEDWAAFASWSREFRRRCESNRWLETPRLSDFLRDRAPRPKAVFLAGFDEITPLETEFLEALGEWRAVPVKEYSGAIERRRERRKLADSSAEIRSAAAWARGLLEKDPETQVGIIVAPDLTRLRPNLDRILGKILGEGVFHLSVGPLLAEYPLVRSALLMLEFAAGALPLPRAGMLLRSPFLGGSEKEWGKRAQLDARLRKNGIWELSLSRLLEEASSCPELQRVLRKCNKRLRKIADEQPPSGWSACIEDLLEALGWPGDRAPSSVEFQTIEAWRGLLSSLESLDLTAPWMNLEKVIDWLDEKASNIRFQIEDEGAPVQVMGMLEAAGLRFDHLWIMGLHDEALPGPANPNPFLPVSLQLRHGLPHSSAERELEFATKLLDRLLASAPDVVLSYPQTEGDRTLAPSPLVADGLWLADGLWSEAEERHIPVHASAPFDNLADESGPAVVQGDSTGGASIFKDMAACPFRSFAKHRLGARPLEETDLGLSYRDRGTTVHKALEFIWAELRSHAQLMELNTAELDALITRGADAAAAKLGPGIGRDLEKQRLQRLLAEWLNIEKSRPEFTVAGIEAERAIAIAGLQVKVRADRVDALPDGREIILDYKTGQLKSRGWEGERPDEPQLPLYCVSNERPVAAAAFALIRTGELQFRGSGAGLPEMVKMKIDPPLPFDAQMEEWRRVLEHLAQEFRAGRAEVDPKPGACDNCGLRALCRIRELENDRG